MRDHPRASLAEGVSGETVPRWMPASVVVLILAVLGVTVALVASLLTGSDAAPPTIYDRNVMLRQDMVAKNPQDVLARASLAQAYLDAGRYQDAIDEADRALAIEAEDLTAHYVKAEALRSAGRLEASIAIYDAILAAWPQDLEAHYGKAMSLRAKGDRGGAIIELETILRSRPVAADVRVELGELYRAEGETGRARAEFEKALRYIPDYLPALRALEQLGLP
ncbi:MAG: tetratricopeptide repeat protein [Thermoleophilia bacterium]|nr:tetratricopeptide repeat protein [Thermoleophilia bacterium]